MISKKFGALATALLLSAACATGASLLTATPAFALTVRPAVGKALDAAIKDAAAGRGSAAQAELHEAESQPNLTSAEQQAIEQTRNYVAAKTGTGGGSVGAKAKFANDYNAGRYSEVVGPDAEELRRTGAMDGESEVIVAQAYYLMHDYEKCISYVQRLGHVSQNTLELLMRCAYEAHDEQATQSALEQLVVDYNQPKYWSDLLDSADRTGSLSTQNELDIYRLRLLTGTMKPIDYETAAEIAIQLGFPTEGVAIVQKGMSSQAIRPDRGARLLALANKSASQDLGSLAKTAAAADAAKNGDALVKLGQDYWGMGRLPEAKKAIEDGIAKGVTNSDDAQIHLGMVDSSLRQKESALHALAQVSKSAPPATLSVARLWSIYAKTH